MAAAAELLTSDAALHPFIPKWRDLAAELGRPAAHPDWVLAMPRGADAMRVIATLDAGGELTGIMPLEAVRRPWGTELRPLGAQLAEGFALMAQPGCEDGLVYATSALLREHERDLAAIHLSSVLAADQWARRLVEGAGWGRRLRTVRKPAPYAELDAPAFESWWQTRSKNFRHAVSKSERRLVREGGEVCRIADATQLPSALEAFFRLHRERWAHRGGSAVLTADVEHAIGRAAPSLLSQGVLRLWMLRQGGDFTAALLCLAAGSTLTTWLGGFSRAAGAVQGPLLLRVAAVRDAYDLGCRTVDLGTGATEWKRRLATGERAVESVSVHESGVHGAAAAAVTAALHRARRTKRALQQRAEGTERR